MEVCINSPAVVDVVAVGVLFCSVINQHNSLFVVTVWLLLGVMPILMFISSVGKSGCTKQYLMPSPSEMTLTLGPAISRFERCDGKRTKVAVFF